MNSRPIAESAFPRFDLERLGRTRWPGTVALDGKATVTAIAFRNAVN
ncbi:hypothetical protein [Leptolyngbya iicbica]|uniref:Uncharacterized protein n=1 Tax=Lyngbya confervoides BDU141951 TaxID=1574623 RepID=A0A8T6QTI3_9CYAN|nr:hypothetical protein [Leptolyngbya sp. LK]